MRCCAHNTGIDIPAAYLWTMALSGNELPLCVECCATWRADAAKHSYLQAARIRSLPTGA